MAMASRPTDRRTKRLALAIMLVLVVACLEIFSALTLNQVPHLSSLVYRTPAFEPERYQDYLARRDPLLGWPTETWLAEYADERGARRSPDNPAYQGARPCIALYGDSFTFSDEVGDADAWGNVLARRLDCRVENYGVGGYGTDQALLRLERHAASEHGLGEAIMLTLYPYNLNRNVNRWRYLLNGSGHYSFKPMILPDLSDGSLPLFTGGIDAAQTLAEDPAAALAEEGFLPDASPPLAQVEEAFSSTWTLVKVAGKVLGGFDPARVMDEGWREAGLRFLNYPGYYDSPDGLSAQKRGIVRTILSRYARVCVESGAHCAFMLVPDNDIVAQQHINGAHDLAFLKELTPSGIQYLDASSVFSSLDDYCATLTQPDACEGHFNPAGYARIAEFAYAHFLESTPICGASFSSGGSC